ncbi:kinase-like domain-containing protein [Sphaerosporella brunnea]|uniref:mitogen-activated protein kinase n=1 Tax=Sphaerosporella brunnea TaxID=1250544 RepID=A0A5J5F3Z0_9PEZI|nr:kinase-like domain-containing protein [Sphaerosporella brunnea]
MALLASKSQYVPQPHTGSHFQSSATPMFPQPSPTNSEFSEGPNHSDDIRSWDERRVVEWLRSIGCQKYDSVFEKNNITGETLLECDHAVLKELGITKVGDRVRIFVAVKALRAKTYGNGKKRNRDTLAALENVGPIPSYRAHTNHHTPPQNKRYSRTFVDPGTSVLSSSVYTETASENDSQRSGGARIISPPPDSSRSYGPPTSTSTSSKTPRTPKTWNGSNGQVGSPNATRRQNPAQSHERSIMEFDSVKKNCIKVIGEGGATRVVDISGCNTPEAVMRRILKKYSIHDNYILWAIYILTKDHTIRCLGDADLLRIAHDSDRPERSRLILKRRGSPPSPSSAEFLAAQQIARDETPENNTARAFEGNLRSTKVRNITGEDMSGPLSPGMATRSRNSVINHKTSKKITAFFGQRPPSELISSNLAEYFPDHEHKALERTVRNSMRRSARMSKYNSRLSVATTRSYASSISGDSIPPVPTVGGMWLNQSPQATVLPSFPMDGGRRPPSVRRSVLMPTTYSKEEYLGAVPEDDVSPGANRKSYMSFESHDGVSVVVTDTDGDGTLNSTGYSMDSQSMVSTPGTEMDSSFLNQLLAPDDSDEEEFEDDYMDENMDGLRWMKGTLIGAGSFGSVYLALNSLTGELMAVKQVELPTNSKDDARKQSMVDALSREIALLRDLQHPNIVQYLASSKEDNCFNIFLEYVPGGSVAAMLNNYGPLKEPLVRNFVRQILQGLAYLHGKNIIHRDIKGANVLVDNKGGIKISDFGISKKVEAGLLNSSAANHRPSLQGSVFWMAPEVVKQTSYTLKADIWSLGCLVVEMLTGSHPYPDCSQLQAIFKIGTGGSAPQIPEKCTPEAKTFLSQTFELDHNKRPTAEELLTSPFMLPLVGMGGA